MQKLNIPGYVTTNSSSIYCTSTFVQSALGGIFKEEPLKLGCYDKIFICQKDPRKISLKPTLLPDFSDSVESANIQQQILTCEIPFESVNMSEIEMKPHYVWYKDEIPISVDSPILELASYPDPVKQLSSSTIRQGTYRCVVTVEGIRDRYSSQDVNYFYSDIATYILYMQADLKNVLSVDFSDGYFPAFRELLNTYVAAIIEDTTLHVRKLKWDYQMSWKNEENTTVQLLLYTKRNAAHHMFGWNENLFYNTVEKEFERKVLRILSDNSSISLTLGSADTCFEKAVPSSNTSHNVTFLWRTTKQTTSAVSEPMCLNDWRLITRKCRPSVVWGATWGRFDTSKCTKYQYQVKESKLLCPKGYKILGQNLCGAVNSELKTFAEAEETCRDRSSLLADLKQLNKGIRFLNLDTFKYWLSNRGNHRKELWDGNNGTIERRNRTLLCAYRAESFSLFLPEKCNSTESHPFVCIYQPFLLLNAFTFSQSWYKYSHKRSSYYVEHVEKNWHEANKSCHAFPVKSTLVQDIRSLEGYSLFKVLLRQLDQNTREEFSWWMNLFQDGDSLKWLTSPGESPTFVDWERHTDFSMNRSAGVLGVAAKNFWWSLRDLASKQGSICEMQDLKESHRTVVYLEDRTNASGNESDDAYKVDLQCVPSGWFVWNSIFWFKEGENIYTNASQRHLRLTLEVPFTMAEVSVFQGYYYCTADSVNPSEEIFSPKVLIKFPGVHTFVLHMELEIAEKRNCSDVSSLKLPFIEEFNKYLDAVYGNGSGLFLKNVACIYPGVNIYHHVYVVKDEGAEKEIQNSLERTIHSRNAILFEPSIKFDISLKSTVSCSREVSHSNGLILTWPETPIGQSTFPNEVCVTVEGTALERKCLGDFNTGAQWSPMEKNCANVESKIIMNHHKLSKVNITEDNVLNSTRDMERLVTTSEDLGAADVQYVAQILRNVASLPAIEPEVLGSTVRVVDEILEAISTSESKSISPKVSRKITRAVETIALNAQTRSGVVQVAGRNMAVSALPLTFVPRGAVLEKWGTNVTLLLNDSNKAPDERLGKFKDYEVAVILPENGFEKQRNNNRTTMAIAFRKNSLFLKNINVMSPVIDVAMETETVYDVDPPLEMIYKVSKMQSLPQKRNWGCVSWDEALNNNLGGWSYKGCFSVLIDPMHVRCYCNHLTSFAVILEINPEYKMPKSHAGVLSVFTYIGCSLSIFGLGIVILTFSIFRKWREDLKHKILFNLAFSLLSFLLIFLIGIEKTDWEYGCKVVAVLLHFFMLATFFWMLVEAFLQYLCLVKVIGTYIPHFLRKAMLFAWGTPIIIVAIGLAVDHKLYHHRTPFCWVSGDVFYYAVALPVLASLAFNFMTFGVIFCSVTFGRSKQKLRSNQDEKKLLVARAKAMFCVSVLLGLSWVFGVLAAMEEIKLLCQYLFVITTTLQGFLFFVFFVFRQKNTRDLWRNLMRAPPISTSTQSVRLKEF